MNFLIPTTGILTLQTSNRYSYILSFIVVHMKTFGTLNLPALFIKTTEIGKKKKKEERNRRGIDIRENISILILYFVSELLEMLMENF